MEPGGKNNPLILQQSGTAIKLSLLYSIIALLIQYLCSYIALVEKVHFHIFWCPIKDGIQGNALRTIYFWPMGRQGSIQQSFLEK